jgi:hypothetical protein
MLGTDDRDWLDEYVITPEVFGPGSDLPSCLTRWRYLDWFAMELAVGGETVDMTTCRMLDRLAAGMADDGLDGVFGSNLRYEVIATAAVGAIPDLDLLTVARVLGYGRARIDCSIDDVAAALRAVMVKKLTFAMYKMMRRRSRQLGAACDRRISLRERSHAALSAAIGVRA